MNYLATGENPPRLGNQHPNIVPYQVMPSADGYFVLSVANDPAFERFCGVAGCRHLLDDRRFATAVARVRNRDAVTETLNAVTRTRPTAWWLERLDEAGVGNGAINTLEEVFADPQVKARRDGGGDGASRDRRPAGEAHREPHQALANPGQLSRGPAHPWASIRRTYSASASATVRTSSVTFAPAA